MISIPPVRQMRTALIDRGSEVLHRPEAEGAMADQFDLVVHAFHGSVWRGAVGSKPERHPDERADWPLRREAVRGMLTAVKQVKEIPD